MTRTLKTLTAGALLALTLTACGSHKTASTGVPYVLPTKGSPCDRNIKCLVPDGARQEGSLWIDEKGRTLYAQDCKDTKAALTEARFGPPPGGSGYAAVCFK